VCTVGKTKERKTSKSTRSNATTVCKFDKTKQISVEYQPIGFKAKKKALGNDIPYGKVWAPGGKPMTMFTNTTVVVDGKDIPVGAHILSVIPDQNAWTMIVNRNTDISGKYDDQQDLARIHMNFGELSSPESQFSVDFAHVAPDQCNIRLDPQKTRAWVTIEEMK